MAELWTSQEMRKFDRLTAKLSSQDGNARIMARLALRGFVAEHGQEKCDAMFAHLKERDRKREAGGD